MSQRPQRNSPLPNSLKTLKYCLIPKPIPSRNGDRKFRISSEASQVWGKFRVRGQLRTFHGEGNIVEIFHERGAPLTTTPENVRKICQDV
ncbi:hypothetical protein CDAR_194231 [Caerostris darwini]|uniref:Uncharacterized protein n=1 Tax=Caerostris darwini TaxID=1538125 RepID=A0AAV4Q2R5_9ARAC|nr:hypothetical protein CDAR_194231 [Caerostris darwini]